MSALVVLVVYSLLCLHQPVSVLALRSLNDLNAHQEIFAMDKTARESSVHVRFRRDLSKLERQKRSDASADCSSQEELFLTNIRGKEASFVHQVRKG